MVSKLGTNEVLEREAAATTVASTTAEASRIVTTYGQRGWAAIFNNGLSIKTMAASGLPTTEGVVRWRPERARASESEDKAEQEEGSEIGTDGAPQ